MNAGWDAQRFRAKTVLISAGGTGGHVYPALAVANRLRELGANVEWLGTTAGIEAELVPEAGMPLHTIFVQGLRGNGLGRMLKAPFVVASAVMQARKLLQKIQPEVFVGFGGFASGPGALAAKLCGVDVIAHEQNAAMGLTNRLVSKWAKRMLLAFAIPNRQGTVVGNPVRRDIAAIPPPQHRLHRQSPFRVLVVGGSLGAKAINDVVPAALSPLLGSIHLTHQTGKTTHEATLADYKQRDVLQHDNLQVTAYIDDMRAAYENADLLIARAGASTVSEVATVGLAAIFIPLPQAVDNHQLLNAGYLADAQAACIIEQADLTASSLRAQLQKLLQAETLQQMATRGRELSHADALEKMITAIDKVIYADATND